MIKWLKRLFGIQSPAEVWRDSIYAEAASRGAAVQDYVRDGVVIGYLIVHRERGTLYIGAVPGSVATPIAD